MSENRKLLDRLQDAKSNIKTIDPKKHQKQLKMLSRYPDTPDSSQVSIVQRLRNQNLGIIRNYNHSQDTYVHVQSPSRASLNRGNPNERYSSRRSVEPQTRQ